MVLNLIVNRDKIKETYLSANDTDFKILFSSSDWHRMYKKAIFLVEDNSYIVEELENNHTYPLPEACVGNEFFVYIVGEMGNEFKSTEKLLIRVMGGGSGGSSEEEYASKAIYGDNVVSMGRKEDTTVGNSSFAFGENVTASGKCSHAEGYNAKANGYCSHAEGYNTKANGMCSHAEGDSTTASNERSHAEGYYTKANGYCCHAEGYYTTAVENYSHAEGYSTTAKGLYSHAEGYVTTALQYQHAQGYYNDVTVATANSSTGTGEGTAFVIGNGSDSSKKSNAFRVDYNGKVFAKSEYASTGADYAEYFEWLDGNENDEDRRGFFVTLDGDKIKKANPDDYILGIVSGQPAVLGNNDECYMGRYELDEFGSYIEEEITINVERVDEETRETKTIQETAKKWKEKETYDPTLPYVPRAKRKEWSAVGMLGVLSVRDDGTCEVNGYCKCGDDGIATKAEEGYRVIKRINNNIVKVILK
ncbi:MAG: hypothetical protein HDT30_01000 [Clostridiales bacterium]|nr:hypothetical protein [Clostridiales bacterium]